ncbi:hypothetical protein AB9F45_39315, partial [Rhizobium leguminosarum]|uniref:hypothetical protein n=1 Tax=Rhizobium leguminosarum TaxID=384 RepID=UPI003F99B264
RRDLSDSLLALLVFVFTHAVVAKPPHTFARHALELPRFSPGHGNGTDASKNHQACSAQGAEVLKDLN